MYGHSDVWLPRYASMGADVRFDGADVGVFQVADAPTYGYISTLPKITISCNAGLSRGGGSYTFSPPKMVSFSALPTPWDFDLSLHAE